MLAWQLPSFIQSWDKGGPFVAGIVFGTGITLLLLKLVSGERKKRLDVDAQREDVLRKQIVEKDKRIDALHDQISKLLKEKATALNKKPDSKGSQK